MDSRAIALAIPFFLAMIALEVWVDRRRRKQGKDRLYRFADSITSLACGVGQQVLAVLIVGTVQIGAYALVWEHLRIFDLSPSSALVWVFAFIGTDLAYYAYHRASHRVNFFWATHDVHHQSEEYNLSTALRQSWFTALTAWIFYTPLAILGVPTAVFVLCLTLNTLYQFWIHTRAVGKLGRFEIAMNTPSHHRVHHGIDPEYIDKNYAGVFIIWDKLFGTFIEEDREPAYGTVKPLASFNPFWANVDGFARLIDMSRRTSKLEDKLLVWIKPPEWRPDDLGGPVVVPPVDHTTRVKYDVARNRSLFRYVNLQFVASAAIVFGVLWFSATLPFVDVAALVGIILITLGTWGGLLERRPWGLPVEAVRLGLLGLTLLWVFRASDLAPWVAIGWALFAAACAVWLVGIVKEERARLSSPDAASIPAPSPLPQ